MTSTVQVCSGTPEQHDLERRVRPVGEAYRDLIGLWRHRFGNEFVWLR